MRGARAWIARAMAIQPIGVMLALSSISDTPMSAPGRTRWVTSAGHLHVQVLQEATWSHSCFTFRLLSLTGLQGSCVHNYPFTVSVSFYTVGGTTPLLNVYPTFEHMLVMQFRVPQYTPALQHAPAPSQFSAAATLLWFSAASCLDSLSTLPFHSSSSDTQQRCSTTACTSSPTATTL